MSEPDDGTEQAATNEATQGVDFEKLTGGW